MSQEECRACVLERRQNRFPEVTRLPSPLRRNDCEYCKGLYESDSGKFPRNDRIKFSPKYFDYGREEYLNSFSERKLRNGEKYSRPSPESDFDEYYKPFRCNHAKYDHNPDRVFTVKQARPSKDICDCLNCRCTKNGVYKPRNNFHRRENEQSGFVTVCPKCISDGNVGLPNPYIDKHGHYFTPNESETEYCPVRRNSFINGRETRSFMSNFGEKISSLFKKHQNEAKLYAARTDKPNLDILLTKIDKLEDDLQWMKDKLRTSECVHGTVRVYYTQLKTNLDGLNELAGHLKKEMMNEYFQRVSRSETALTETWCALISRAASVQEQVRVLQERVKLLSKNNKRQFL